MSAGVTQLHECHSDKANPVGRTSPAFGEVLLDVGPGSCEQGEGPGGSAFDVAWLEAVGAFGVGVQDWQWLLGLGGLEPAQGIDEADPIRRHALACRGLEHHQPDHVVHQGIDCRFFLHARRALAAQHVHAHRLLEVPEVGLDAPPGHVQLGDLGGGIGRRVQQRGGQHDVLGAVAMALDLEADHPHLA